MQTYRMQTNIHEAFITMRAMCSHLLFLLCTISHTYTASPIWCAIDDISLALQLLFSTLSTSFFLSLIFVRTNTLAQTNTQTHSCSNPKWLYLYIYNMLYAHLVVRYIEYVCTPPCMRETILVPLFHTLCVLARSIIFSIHHARTRTQTHTYASIHFLVSTMTKLEHISLSKMEFRHKRPWYYWSDSIAYNLENMGVQDPCFKRKKSAHTHITRVSFIENVVRCSRKLEWALPLCDI